MDVGDSSYRILAGLLEARTGQQLTLGRRWRLETALKGLMRKHGIPTLAQLITRLVASRDASLGDEVVDALLNNETYFFRDRAPFEILRSAVLPAMKLARAPERRLSIWCAGVSTGQEAYSLAMMFAEDAAQWAGWTIDILGTDISSTAIQQARAGVYSQFEVQRGLPVVQMVRWFETQGDAWRVAGQLQRSVRFQAHSVFDSPPAPRRFDLVLCRNLLLYFAADKRRAAFARLGQAIASDGVLMLGAGETVIGQTDRFVPDPQARGLYRASPERPQSVALPEGFLSPSTMDELKRHRS